MKTSTPEIEDFLNDREFVDWVYNPTKESDNYWQSWADAHPEHNEKMKQARELLLSFKFNLPKPGDNTKKDVLENVLREIGNHQSYSYNGSSGSFVNYALKIAAVFVLLISTVYVVYRLSNSVQRNGENKVATNEIVKEVEKGRKVMTQLPDNTKVWLNAESKISYNAANYGDNDRIVKLQGEAYFEVTKDADRPFIVKSGEVETKALGTSFNVKAFPEQSNIEIALVEGSVEVKNIQNPDKAIILNPNEKATYTPEDEDFLKSNFQKEQVIGWKDGLIYFTNANYTEVKNIIERWYGVTIHCDPSIQKDWKYTAKFDNQSLELVLQRIAYTKNFEYELDMSSKEVFLKPKN